MAHILVLYVDTSVVRLSFFFLPQENNSKKSRQGVRDRGDREAVMHGHTHQYVSGRRWEYSGGGLRRDI